MATTFISLCHTYYEKNEKILRKNAWFLENDENEMRTESPFIREP